MQVNSIGQFNNIKSKKFSDDASPSFKARPQEILEAMKNADLCFGQEQVLLRVAKFFREFDSVLPKTYDYKLGEINRVTPMVGVLKVQGQTMKEMDEFLNTSKIACEGRFKKCNCEKPVISEFIKKFMKDSNLSEPNIIRIGQDTKK